MKKLKILRLALLLSLITSNISLFSEKENLEFLEKTKTIYDKLSSEDILRSNLDKKTLGKIEENSTGENPENDINPKKIVDIDTRNIIFNIFSRVESKNNRAYQPILNETLIQDIELFSSEFFSKINKTHTFFGEVELAKMLYTPTTDILTLEKNQNIIKSLLKNESFIKQMDFSLEAIYKNQERILEFFKEKSKAEKTAIKKCYFANDSLNKNSLLLDLKTRTGQFGVFVFSLLPVLISSGLLIKTKISNLYVPTEDMKMAFSIGGASAFVYAPFLYLAFRLVKNNAKTIKSIQENLINNFIPIIQNMKDLCAIFNTYPEFKKTFPAYKNLKKVVIGTEEKAQELETLINLLETPTFQNKASYASRVGKVLVAYKITEEINEDLLNALVSIAQMDAYISIAKLYKEFENQKTKYCFVKYSNQNTPHFYAKNFWNPNINTENIELNSFELGKDNTKGAIITGPSFAGKSTILKSVLIAVLLSQTIGIAPAEDLIITPFEKIISCIQPLTKSRNSLRSEISRAYELEAVLNENKKTFIFYDEILKDINPIEGAAATYSITKNLGKYPNTLLMSATNFPLITKLEQETNGNFKNYKVDTGYTDGKINFLYKLEDGITNKIIDIDMLKFEKNSEILEEAALVIKDCREKGINLFDIKDL